jgi:citrate lyase subunit gamma (acyl carrier protein)
MKILKVAKAGTLESNDLLVMVMPTEKTGIVLELESIVIKLYGDKIKETVLKTLTELAVDSVHIKIQDKGALDYTIEARVETAIRRAVKEVAK